MHASPIRGRPAGQMTIAKRKVLAFVIAKQEAGEPIVWAEMMRACGFSCRANAKRTVIGLQKMGVLTVEIQGDRSRRLIY
jgi:hypothetical protein